MKDQKHKYRIFWPQTGRTKTVALLPYVAAFCKLTGQKTKRFDLQRAGK